MTRSVSPPRTAGASPETASRALAEGQTDAVGQLVARRESFKAALEIAQAILAGEDPDAMWEPIARRARRLVRADAAIVRTPGLEGGTLVLRGVDRRRPGDRQPGLLLREEPVAGSVCGIVFETGRARTVSDLETLAGFHRGHATRARTSARTVESGLPGTGLDRARPREVAGRIPTGPAAIVPLSAKGRVMGILAAVNRSDRPLFRQYDVDLLRTFAGQAALAIQQAQVRRELQRLSVIEERERLARELHDDAIQSLYGITLDLASAAARAGDPVLRERMARLVWTVDGVIQDLRNHVYGLRSSVLAGRRLDAALRQLARDFEWQSGTTTFVEVETEAAERLHEQADDVVQIAREALSNVGRHARARSCRLRLGLREGEAWLVVRDDGVGFDPRRVEARGHGLRNFEERATRLGGRLDIESSPNGGTEVRIAIPLRPPRHPVTGGPSAPERSA
jgi:signal transduction histidine kinase